MAKDDGARFDEFDPEETGTFCVRDGVFVLVADNGSGTQMLLWCRF